MTGWVLYGSPQPPGAERIAYIPGHVLRDQSLLSNLAHTALTKKRPRRIKATSRPNRFFHSLSAKERPFAERKATKRRSCSWTGANPALRIRSPAFRGSWFSAWHGRHAGHVSHVGIPAGWSVLRGIANHRSEQVCTDEGRLTEVLRRPVGPAQHGAAGEYLLLHNDGTASQRRLATAVRRY